jgi:DNA invertase Pin-like site-specific DNA recombinase
MAKRRNDPTGRVIGYVRVSTDEQAISGLGLDAQRAAIEAAATARGWTIVGWTEDAGVSGGVLPTDRPGLGAAIVRLCRGEADVLVAAKLDRLSRSVRHLLALLDEASRCRFGVVALDSDVDTTSASGRLITTVLGGVAEWERGVISERTKAALQVKKAAGARLGGPVTTPAVIRNRVEELRAQGVSIAKIAEQLNAEGHRTSVYTEWTKAGVQRLLRSLALDAEAERARKETMLPSGERTS